MEKVIGITQARIGSSRLPGKVLLKIKNKSILAYHIENLIQSKLVNKWIVATTNERDSDKILEIANFYDISCYKGDLNNVLDRFYKAALIEKPDYIVRVTSDCPLIDSRLIDEIVEYTLINNLNYCSTSINYPDGIDVEVFKFLELEEAFFNASIQSDKEHVTPYIKRKENNSQIQNEYKNIVDYSKIRLTVDEESDFKAIKILIEKVGQGFPWIDYVNYIINNPLQFNNQNIIRNEGYLNSLKKD